MPICTICKTRQAEKKIEVVPEPIPTLKPTAKRGRGRPRTVENFKEAKKVYNSTYYQRKKERQTCKLDDPPTETTT